MFADLLAVKDFIFICKLASSHIPNPKFSNFSFTPFLTICDPSCTQAYKDIQIHLYTHTHTLIQIHAHIYTMLTSAHTVTQPHTYTRAVRIPMLMHIYTCNPTRMTCIHMQKSVHSQHYLEACSSVSEDVIVIVGITEFLLFARTPAKYFIYIVLFNVCIYEVILAVSLLNT